MSRSQPVLLQPGFLLHRRLYRDTSLLLEVFTRDFGRIALVARGVRRRRSPLAGLLQPFQPLLFSWQGGGELQTLRGAEPGGTSNHLAGQDILTGFYLNELLLRLLPRHDAHPELYDAYLRTLAGVGGREGEWGLRLFEKQLLEGVGYGLNLTEEADTGSTVQPEGQYCYHLERGAVRAQAGATAGLLVTGRTLLRLNSGDRADAVELREAKRLMRAALALYLGDKPLKSRELFQRFAAGQSAKGSSDETTIE